MIRYDRITPEGTRDLLFRECEAQNAVADRLRGIFEEKGYREIRTPGLEFYDVFSAQSAYYPQESIYKLIDDRGRLLAMRPDSTIPIARMTATKLKGHELPIRIHYAQRVFRRQPEHKGRRSEVLQMGVELIGAATFASDAEVLTAAAEGLRRCAASSRVEIGHVGVFNLLMADLEAAPAEKERIHSHIASKNYAALNDVLEGLRQDRTTALLRELPRLFGGAEALAQAQKIFNGYNGKLTEMLEYLENIYRMLEGLDLNDQIMIDFGLVNQTEYYSSLVFKGYVESSGDAVLSGGRYDGLFKEFGEDLPATGFAFNVDALADGLLRDGAPAARADRTSGTNLAPDVQTPAAETDPVGADLAPGAQTPAAETDPVGTNLAPDARTPAGDPPAPARLRVALTKGRLEAVVVNMLEAAGYDVGGLREKGRKLLLAIAGANMEVVLAKAADVITYVEHGVCDVGVVGKDTIAEQGGVFYEILDLGVGKCRFALAAPAGVDFYGGFGARRIATKYPRVAASWFESKGMDVQIIKIEGSVELAPLLSLADGIVDLVETGSTLRENGLEVVEDIRAVSARMIVNVAAMKLKKKEIDALAAALQGAARAPQYGEDGI